MTNADLVTLLLRSWSQQRDYAERLIRDLSDADMTAQPVAGVTMNHPAWALGHLSAYPPVLAAMARRETPVDPISHPFGRDSKPVNDPTVYGSKEKIVSAYFGAHDELADTLASVDPSVMNDPIRVERWRERFPTLAHACFYLMTTHEATHLGQISAWRRAGGRPAV